MQLTGRWLREIFSELLIEHAKSDDRICYIEADLMLASGTGGFKEQFPDRTINVGVAEANMISVAAGVSTLGMIPFTHSFTPFATRRCCDQITLSVSYAKNNVKMIGSDPGITAMLNGGTHMSMEDVAIMRNIPGMCIVEPIDGVQLVSLFPQILNHDGPVYIRLLRREAKSVYSEGESFTLGKSSVIHSGKDVTIIASGIMVSEAIQARELLMQEGIDAGIIDCHTIKPFDNETLIKEASISGAVVTAENHSIINGLGSAVAECLSENLPLPMRRVGVKDHFGEVGMQDFLAEKFGLTAKDIVNACKQVVGLKGEKQC
ncbi:MAG: transketolase family protein [Clostridia bacterium]|nr:transketolase family protein [Clostridia bacterium]